MNLNAIVSGAISAVNPRICLSIQVSEGQTVNPDGSQSPVFAPAITVPGQVQPISTGDLKKLESLNIQGVNKKIYINGQVSGLVRPNKCGGDLITLPNGQVYLVSAVLESWPDWCCAAVVLQNGA